MLPGRGRPADRLALRLRRDCRPRPVCADRLRACVGVHRHVAGRRPRPRARSRSPPGRRHARGARGVLDDPGRNQLRVGLVPDAEKARRPLGLFHGRDGHQEPVRGAGSLDGNRAQPDRRRRDRRRPRPGPRPRAYGAVCPLPQRPRRTSRHRPRRTIRRGDRQRRELGGRARRPPRQMGRVRRYLALRRPDGPVPQARADLGREPRPCRRRRVPRPRPAHDVRRQPGPARAPHRRHPHLRP